MSNFNEPLYDRLRTTLLELKLMNNQRNVQSALQTSSNIGIVLPNQTIFYKSRRRAAAKKQSEPRSRVENNENCMRTEIMDRIKVNLAARRKGSGLKISKMVMHRNAPNRKTLSERNDNRQDIYVSGKAREEKGRAHSIHKDSLQNSLEIQRSAGEASLLRPNSAYLKPYQACRGLRRRLKTEPKVRQAAQESEFTGWDTPQEDDYL